MQSFEEKTIPVDPKQIKVSVEPYFLNDQSSPKEGVFAFAYKVKIENHRPETIQLLGRHWLVSSGGEVFAEVAGEGVVGVKPYLKPEQAFEYTSWTVIKDPIGSMQGRYFFITEDNSVLAVEIPEFTLKGQEYLQ